VVHEKKSEDDVPWHSFRFAEKRLLYCKEQEAAGLKNAGEIFSEEQCRTADCDSRIWGWRQNLNFIFTIPGVSQSECNIV
jgi:hypothetical protein